jgi:hypothetical protein
LNVKKKGWGRSRLMDLGMLGESWRCSLSVNGLHLSDSSSPGGKRDETSTYTSYRIWLASLSLYCGWKVECEVLRIPSARNWAVVGRRRVSENGKDGEERARARRNSFSSLALVHNIHIIHPYSKYTSLSNESTTETPYTPPTTASIQFSPDLEVVSQS